MTQAELKGVRLFGDSSRLTPLVFEDVLLRAGLLRKGDEFSVDVERVGALIDLSKIEWVDFSVVAELCLLVHRIAAAGIRVEVLLPDRRDAANAAILSVADLKRPGGDGLARRVRVFRFLEYIRFPEAIAYQSQTAIWVTPKIYVDGGATEYRREERNVADTYTEKLVPLTWIDHQNEDNHVQFARFLTKVIGRSGVGLREDDARGLASVIVFELVENVFKHSGNSGPALVSAWAHAHDMPPVVEGYPAFEQNILQAAHVQGAGVVEIFVGDSGVGLAENLRKAYQAKLERAGSARSKRPNPEHVIDWAFDRWSSSGIHDIRERGVRGLYRVERHTRKYRGLISVHTHRTLRYRSHFSGAGTEIATAPGFQSYRPGTALRIRLFVDTDKSISQAVAAQGRDGWASRSGSRPIRLFNIGRIDENGIEASRYQGLVELLASEQVNQNTAIVLLASGEGYVKRLIEKALLQLVQVASPHLVAVLGLPGTDAELESSAASVSEVGSRLQRDDPSSTFASDPVVIISRRGSLIWAGVSALQAQAYGLVLSKPGLTRAELMQALRASEARTADEWDEFAKALRTHIALLSASASAAGSPGDDLQQQLRIGLDLDVLVNSIGLEISQPIQTLADWVQEKKKSVEAPKAVAGLEAGPFVTPSLQTVSVWIRAFRYLTDSEHTVQSRHAVFALAMRVRAADTTLDKVHAVLSDGGATRAFRDEFAECLGVQRLLHADNQDADQDVPAAFDLSPLKVLVFADLVASTETVKRTVVYAMRLGYVVSGIACLLDTRSDAGAPIRVWGTDISIIAVCNVPTQLLEAQGPLAVISPFGENEGQYARREKLSVADVTEALPIGSFTRSHVERPNGRHLSFVANGLMLLENEAVIRRIKEKVSRWLLEVKAQSANIALADIVVWTPKEDHHGPKWIARVESIFSAAGAGHQVSVVALRKHDIYDGSDFGSPRPVVGKNVIVFDWGAVTGSTAMQLTRHALDQRCSAVLALTVVSQMPRAEEEFLSSVSQLSAEVPGDAVDLLTAPPMIRTQVRVRFEWLESFRLGHFAATTCPLCMQRAALLAARPRTAFLQNYQKDEVRRLEPRPLQDALRNPEVFANKGFEFHPALVSAFRRRLFASSSSTIVRGAIRDDLVAARRLMSTNRTARRFAVMVVSTLSDEPYWLKRAPLHFRQIRAVLADISLNIALHDSSSDVLRSTAIRVLRKVGKQRYVKELLSLLTVVVKRPSLVQTLLFGVSSLLQRGYHEHVELLRPLQDELYKCASLLDSGASREFNWPARAAIAELEAECRFLLERLGSRQLTAPQAYSNLRHRAGLDFAKHAPPHGNIISLVADVPRQAMRQIDRTGLVNAGLSDAAQASANVWLKNCGADWQQCVAFLEKLMPLIQQVLPTLNVRDRCTGPNEQDVRKLRYICDHYSVSGYPPPLPVTNAINRLNECRNIEAFFGKALASDWALVDSELDWFQSMFFEPARESKLWKIFSDCPSDFGDCHSAGFAAGDLGTGHVQLNRVRGDEVKWGIKVYCSKLLLRSVFEQIFRNMGLHYSGLPKSGPDIDFGIIVDRSQSIITTVIYNNNTKAFPSSEKQEDRVHGLTLLNEDLEHFGASLEWGRTLDGLPEDTTFYARLTLQVWTGVSA